MEKKRLVIIALIVSSPALFVPLLSVHQIIIRIIVGIFTFFWINYIIISLVGKTKGRANNQTILKTYLREKNLVNKVDDYFK